MTAAGLLLLAAGLAAAAEPEVRVKAETHASFDVVGHFTVQAPRHAAWSALTDYDNIADFVSSMRSSRVRERFADHVLVEQTAAGEFFFFSQEARVVLKVWEYPGAKIEFEDVSRLDFRSYAGSWEIEAKSGGLEVTYRLQAEPRVAAPRFVKKRALRKGIQKLLAEVRSEISRRSIALARRPEDEP